MERTGAGVPAPSSPEAKTLGAPFSPSTAGQITKLISSMKRARRKAPLAPSPPSSSRHLTPTRGAGSPEPALDRGPARGQRCRRHPPCAVLPCARPSTQTAHFSLQPAAGDTRHVPCQGGEPYCTGYLGGRLAGGARRRDKGEAMRPHRRLVPDLFAGLDVGFLHRRVCTTRPAFGRAEPNRRQILVGVVARANLPTVNIGAQWY